MRLDEIIGMIPQSELDRAIEMIIARKPKAEDSKGSSTVCPHCGSDGAIRYGTDRNGRQRYRCRCGRTFTERTGSAFHHARVSDGTLRKFLDLEFSGMTLSELSYHTGLSVTTCHHLRRRLQRACLDYVEGSIRLSGTVQVDSSYTKINLKGTKESDMPRKSKRRGNGAQYSGISHHKVCISAAIDENDNCIMAVTGLGPESAEKYSFLRKYLKDVTTVVSDSKPSIRMLSNSIGAESDMIRPVPAKDGKTYVPENAKRHVTPSGRHIQDLNELVKCIKDQIRARHGMSTRYLNDWLAFLCVRKMFHYRYKRCDIAERLMEIMAASPHTGNAAIAATPQPVSLKQAYWDYHYGIFNDSTNT